MGSICCSYALQVLEHLFELNFEENMRAGFLSRTTASLIDWILIIVLATPFVVLLAKLMNLGVEELWNPDPEFMKARLESGSEPYSDILGPQLFLQVGSLMIISIYFLTELFGSASPGKYLLGLRIGSEMGSLSSPQERLFRYLLINGGAVIQILLLFVVYFMLGNMRAMVTGLLIYSGGMILVGLYSMVLFFGLFGIFFANRQALHDKLSGTAVYIKRKWDPSEVPEKKVVDPLEVPKPKRENQVDAVNKLIFK